MSISETLHRSSEKLIGLNIIVGAGESKDLERCLKSCVGDLFDEIVICLCMEKEDPEVKAVAEKYATIVGFFKWNDDFSDARNYSFSLNTSKMIMWLDADDVIKPENYRALLDLKPKMSNWDIIICDYVYSHDEKDNPALVLPRERIVKKCQHIKWHDPIHEYMNIDVPLNKQHKTKIKVDHYRTKAHNPARNLDLLEKKYKSKDCSERVKFYYGKELADCGYWDRALPILEKYIDDGKDYKDNLTVACIRMAKYYQDKNDLDSAKNYALKGIRYNSTYAENFVIMGIIFENKKDTDTASAYYKEALSKKLEGGMSQIVDYYGFIPATKLALLYFDRKEYEESLKYSDLALTYKTDNQQLKELSKTIRLELERLSKGSILQDSEIEEIKKFFEGRNFNLSVLKNNMDFSDIRIRKIKNLSIIWLIPSLNLNNPSTRIRRYNISNKLSDMGVESKIITDYYGINIYELRNTIGDASVVVFTQFSKEDLEIMKYLKNIGIKCVFDHCEALFGYPYEDDCMANADLIACCSTKLAELTNERGYNKTAVLKDAVEEVVFNKPHEYKRNWE